MTITKARREMAKLIFDKRAQLGYSQTKFAQALDTTVTTISRLEAGKQVPGGPLTVKLILAGVPVEKLDAAFDRIRAEKA